MGDGTNMSFEITDWSVQGRLEWTNRPLVTLAFVLVYAVAWKLPLSDAKQQDICKI